METTSSGPTVDSVADRTKSTVDRAAQSAHEAIDKLASKAGPAIDKLRSTTSQYSDTLRQKAGQFGEMEEQWLENGRSYVRENPLTAVAIGVLAGIVIAKIASSK